jgi:phosphotransacetylase
MLLTPENNNPECEEFRNIIISILGTYHRRGIDPAQAMVSY